ncbi:MAG: hypothetical protein AAF809_13910 [Bacteroidota bacterium]
MLLTPLPDAARLWIFTSTAPLTADNQAALLAQVNRFLDRWTSHERPVRAAATVLHDRFLAVGAVIEEGAPNAGVSGCGIDKLTHAAAEAGAALGTSWADGLLVVFEDTDGRVRVVPRREFRALGRTGDVHADTAVFVTTLDTVGALRAESLRRPAHESWHGRTFRLEPPPHATSQHTAA